MDDDSSEAIPKYELLFLIIVIPILIVLWVPLKIIDVIGELADKLGSLMGHWLGAEEAKNFVLQHNIGGRNK